MLAVLTSGESSSLQQLASLRNKAETADTALASSQCAWSRFLSGLLPLSQ